MADGKDKFADIKDLLAFFEHKFDKISKKQAEDYKKMRLDAEEEVANVAERNAIYIAEHVAELRAQETLETDEESAAYTIKMQDDFYKRKLASEIDILKEISKEETDKRAKQTKILETEKKLQKEKNAGDTKKVKETQKQLDILKRQEAISKKKEKQIDHEKQLKEEGAGYEFGDNLKEILQAWKDEKATGNA